VRFYSAESHEEMYVCHITAEMSTYWYSVVEISDQLVKFFVWELGPWPSYCWAFGMSFSLVNQPFSARAF